MNEIEYLYTFVLLLPTFAWLFYVYYGNKRNMKQSSDLNIDSTRYIDQAILVDDDDDCFGRRLRLYEESSLMKFIYDDATTLIEALKRGSQQTADGKCLGTINKITNEMEWVGYKEMLIRTKNFGDGLVQLNQKPKSIIGIFSINRMEYLVAEYGCYWHSMIVCPIYNTFGPNICTFIANQAEIEIIVCDNLDRLQVILSQGNNFKFLKYIIMMDQIPFSYKSKASNFNLKVLTMEEVEKLGASNSLPNKNLPSVDDTALICYTSGTTGIAKGVILTHQNVIAASSAILYQLFEHEFNKNDTYFSYLPLAHIMERVAEVSMLINGAKIGFFSGDIRNIMEDIKVVKPTIFLTVPRLLNKIYDKIFESVRGNWLKKWLLHAAIEAKKRAYREHRLNTDTAWDRLIFYKIRESLGGKVRVLATGSACMNSEVADVLRCILSCGFINGYGQTECPSCCLSIPYDPSIGHVGPPLASAIIKLEDIPEMGYFASEGKGEILVKGPVVTCGYFKNPEETSKIFDKDGWLHTGDVGKWTEHGTLQIIDRLKNFFKLSQGEFIAVEKLENAYTESLFVSQLFVYGDSTRSYLVAIIVPDKDFLDFWCLKNKITLNHLERCQNKKVTQAILDDLKRIAVEKQFNKLEYIKKVYLHPDSLTVESKLITPTMKMKRPEMKKYFAKNIEQLYKL